MTAGLERIVGLLRCPHCGSDLSIANGVVLCELGHVFDVARQGYVNLLPGNARVGTADTAEMVQARQAFLDAGHYGVIADAVAEAVQTHVDEPRCLVEVGAGTAYYATAVLRRQPHAVAIALDASKHAARRAAAHQRTGAIVCDVWRPLPVKDRVAQVVLDVFAPRNGPEMRRILQSDGIAVVVTPRPEHLIEVVQALDLLRVDERKRERLDSAMQGFTCVARTAVGATLLLDDDAIRALVQMGPSAWHTGADGLARRVADLALPMSVSVGVDVSVYRPSRTTAEP